MNETFRLRKAIFIQGIVLTLFFLVVTIVHACIPLYIKPGTHGFNRPGSTVMMACLGVALYGTMLIGSLYTVAAYYVERFSITGSTVKLRSCFQNHQFDISEVRGLVWKTIHYKIVFRLATGKATLGLAGFSEPDRLRIIRLVRSLVPENRQEQWPAFCNKVALRLREGRLPPSVPESVSIFIDRKRYDRLLAVLLPSTLAIGAVVWQLTGMMEFFAIPVLVLGFWMLLRFSTPKDGQWQPRVRRSREGRIMLYGYSLIALAMCVQVACAISGIKRDQCCTAALVVLLIGMPPFFYLLYRADKERKLKDALAAETANERWELGEFVRQDEERVGCPKPVIR